MSQLCLLRDVAFSFVMATLAVSPVLAQPSDQSASQFYLSYRATFDQAKTLDELLPLMSRKLQSQMQPIAASDRVAALQALKALATLSDIKVLSQRQTPEGVTLVVEGIDSTRMKSAGRVDLVREGGTWKLDGENWTPSPPK
jgi:hypothetical protein